MRASVVVQDESSRVFLHSWSNRCICRMERQEQHQLADCILFALQGTGGLGQTPIEGRQARLHTQIIRSFSMDEYDSLGNRNVPVRGR